MTRPRLWPFAAALLAGCYGGPVGEALYACSSAAECAEDMRCDDGVCCRLGGSPACPTLVPENNLCADGAAPRLFYEDLDGDGHGNAERSLVLCGLPTQRQLSEQPGDCNDNPAANGAAFHPGQTDACDGSDNNCNGVFNDPPCANFYWSDADGDGFGDVNEPLGEFGALPPAGAVTNPSDCAPANPEVHPGALEACNGEDENCNGIADDGSGPIGRFYRDADGDGFGDPATFVLACAPPPPPDGQRASYVSDATDCDDARAISYPGAFDACDGLNNNCANGADERPYCGGPGDLLVNPDGALSYGAQNNQVSGGSFRGCRRTGTPTAPVNPTPETFAPPSWTGTGLDEHVAWVETSGRWDLSRPNTSFRLDFSVTGTNLTATDPFYRAGVFEFQPLIVLCDEYGNSNGYVRLGTPLIQSAGVPYSISIPIGGSPSNPDTGNRWLLISRGLDIKNVKWVELVVQPSDPGGGNIPSFTFNLTRLGFE